MHIEMSDLGFFRVDEFGRVTDDGWRMSAARGWTENKINARNQDYHFNSEMNWKNNTVKSVNVNTIPFT